MLLQKLSACEFTASCNWVNLSAMSRVCNISYFPVAQYYVMRYFILFKKTSLLAPSGPHNCWPTPYHNHQLIRVDLSVFGKYYLTQFHFHCWLFCWIALLSLLSSRMMVASASGLAPCVRLFSWQMRANQAYHPFWGLMIIWNLLTEPDTYGKGLWVKTRV